MDRSCQFSISEQVQITKKITSLNHTLKCFLSITFKEGGEDSESYELRDWRLTTSWRLWSLTIYKFVPNFCSWMSYTGLSCVCKYTTFIQLRGAWPRSLILWHRLLDVETHLWLKRPGRRFSRTACEDNTRRETPLKYVIKGLNLLPWLHLWVCHCYLDSDDLKSMKENVNRSTVRVNGTCWPYKFWDRVELMWEETAFSPVVLQGEQPRWGIGVQTAGCKIQFVVKMVETELPQ